MVVLSFQSGGTGNPIREWIYVDDVANLMSLALSVNIDSPEPTNLAQQEGASIKESAELIAKAIGFRGDLVFQPQYQDGAPKKIMNAARFQRVFPNYRFCRPLRRYSSDGRLLPECSSLDFGQTGDAQVMHDSEERGII